MNRLSSFDSYLFHEGTNYEIYKKLGAHTVEIDGIEGVYFALWAPFAKSVSVLTDLNRFTPGIDKMKKIESGIWELFIPEITEGSVYRFAVEGCDGVLRYKSDPYAFLSELRPANASVVYHIEGYRWEDDEYMKSLSDRDIYSSPMAVYELHPGSWKKDYSLNKDGFINYRRLADELSEYVSYMGYTHVELMGICEHPFDGSWGYQVTGYFAPTSRHGSPDDFRYFVDKLHRCGIGVILDWVPAHFPKDSFCLEKFDGSCLYEYSDPLRAEYPQWGTLAFDHGKPEVQSFLISNAFYWIKEFHIDALRVDAVAAMLFNNFSREQWRPNKYGGTENLESIEFLKKLNTEVKKNTGGFLIAEDSSIFSGITSDTKGIALGFSFKWNMGWMNETLKYIETDPVFRVWEHEKLTHSTDYAFLEHYILVLSHDEVVHLKKPMLFKNPGSIEDQMGALKSLYTYMFTHPGKKLLFMGQDFAENREWQEKNSLDWQLASDPWHRAVMDSLRSLLYIYKKYPCLYSDSLNPVCFEWVNRNDAKRNIISYIRRNPWNYNGALLVVINFSPVACGAYCCGVPVPGSYRRIFSSYDSLPGSDAKQSSELTPVFSSEEPSDGYIHRISYGLRPYEAAVFEIPERGKSRQCSENR